jgi:hypothetical protein
MWLDKAQCVFSLSAGKVGATAVPSASGRLLASGCVEDSHFHSQELTLSVFSGWGGD